MKLSKINPSQSGPFEDKDEAEEQTKKYQKKMNALLYKMFAESKHSLLIILQGIDGSGKDGTIKHIFSGSNPQGVRVYSFKEPTLEELRHDFLWRCHKVAPESGFTVIFNRSYYEEVTTVKVHPRLLEKQHLPKDVLKRDLFEKRYEQIRNFEKILFQNGTLILKFLLHISKDEQKSRFQERLKDPSKKWKFTPQDIKERKYFDEYLSVFEEMVSATDSKHAPWHVIPADKKWYRDYLVSEYIVKALEGLKMDFP